MAAFARDQIAPVARQHDESGDFPWGTVAAIARRGLLGVPMPRDLGGSGLDTLGYILVIEELAKVDASHAITVSAHTTLGTSPITTFGTREQQERFVAPLAGVRCWVGSASPKRMPAPTPLARVPARRASRPATG